VLNPKKSSDNKVKKGVLKEKLRFFMGGWLFDFIKTKNTIISGFI
tara:strand:+ start:433 stop:567 length:135 start_codon:yes stop_codon:yes gene_type:complete